MIGHAHKLVVWEDKQHIIFSFFNVLIEENIVIDIIFDKPFTTYLHLLLVRDQQKNVYSKCLCAYVCVRVSALYPRKLYEVELYVIEPNFIHQILAMANR